MDRMACVDLPFFPLQLLLRRQPDWRDRSVAVVDCDKPQGRILWTNERARSLKVLSGMRYATALSIASDLRAATVSSTEIERARSAMGQRLRRFTPDVEPASDEPGLYWLDASGLERLYVSLKDWADRIRFDLKDAGFLAAVVVGFSRFGTYAVARARRRVVVFDRATDERAVARRVSLDRLSLAPKARETLQKLGIATVGEFADLPPEGIEKRFGAEAFRLHRSASGALQLPLQPQRPLPPAVQRVYLDHPETAVPRLMIVIERLMYSLLKTLESRGRLLAGVHVGFRFERLGDHIERIRPASPTRDAAQLVGLIRLRLEAVHKLPDGVSEIVLVAEEAAVSRKQGRLFEGKPRRDLAAANRALARVRAEMGNDTVVRARLREGHLPEGSFTWEPLERLDRGKPREAGRGKLVRRIYSRPVPLRSRSRNEPDGWMLRGLERGPVVRFVGPYVVAGGWWRRAVHREYHFAETRKGELLWIFYDRLRRRWFLQGRVE